MDFRHLTATETSHLIRRLLSGQADVARQRLQALREALDLAAGDLESPIDTDPEVGALAAALAEAAEAEICRVRDEAAADMQAARARLDAQLAEGAALASVVTQSQAETALLQSELRTAHDRAESAERDLTATIDAHAEVEAALREAEANGRHDAQARAGLEAELRAAIERLQAEAGQLRAHIDHGSTQLAELERQLGEATQAREPIAAELEATRMRVREAELTQGRHEEQVRQLEFQLHDAGLAQAQLQGELAARQAASEAQDAAARDQQDRLAAERQEHTSRVQALESELIAARASVASPTAGTRDDPEVERLRGEVDRMVSLFDASARAVMEMAAASTSTELLTELLKRLSLQFSRVALFRLKGNRLEGEQQIGFDDAADVTTIVIPMSVDSCLTRAVSSGTVQSLSGADVAIRSGTPFGGTPSSAVFLPIVLHGTPIAVLYADDSDMPEPARTAAVHESSVGFARLLVGQAIVLLVRHTHELKALAELRQYAGTLLQEAREMYLADTEAGKSPDLVRTRLKDNIDCASQLYAYRAAMEGTAAAVLFDDEIAQGAESNSPFAKDLATIVARMTADVGMKAEAS